MRRLIVDVAIEISVDVHADRVGHLFRTVTEQPCAAGEQRCTARVVGGGETLTECLDDDVDHSPRNHDQLLGCQTTESSSNLVVRQRSGLDGRLVGAGCDSDP